MASPIITLTTDFGQGSPYVAQMKGVILSKNPHAAIVDITHAIAPHNIRQGAVVLSDATPWFSDGAIHVAVIDPGVGTERKIVYAEIQGQRYVAPDNGLLSLLAKRNAPTALLELNNPEYCLGDISNTFHGRDIMAPIASYLSRGAEVKELGEEIEQLTMLQWAEPIVSPGKIVGQVMYVDSFGNLITNISSDLLPKGMESESLQVRCEKNETMGLATTYADRETGSLAAVLDSAGRLELAIVEGNAAAALKMQEGAEVSVFWR